MTEQSKREAETAASINVGDTVTSRDLMGAGTYTVEAFTDKGGMAQLRSCGHPEWPAIGVPIYHLQLVGKAAERAQAALQQLLPQTTTEETTIDLLRKVAEDARDLIACNCGHKGNGWNCEGTCTHGMAVRALQQLQAASATSPLVQLAEVRGTVSIDGGIATLPDGSTVDLRG